MSINAEVTKTGSEPALATIRKFSRRVQGTGLVRSVRGGRYHSRDTSKTVKKKRALKMLKRRAEYQKKVKEGKIVERERTSRRFGPRPQTAAQSTSTNESGGAPIAH